MLNGKKIIALCTSRLGETATFELVAELNKGLTLQDCRLVIGNICSDEEWLKDYMNLDDAVFDLFDYSVIDLVIMMDEKIKNKDAVNRVINTALEHNIPVIAVDSKASNCITVNFDFESGFENVVRHIVEYHGIKDVHIMAGFPDNPFSIARVDVFKKVLKENNIEFTEDMLSYGYFWSDPTIAAMEKLLKRNHIPKAIICCNDIMAINVCVCLQNSGYAVPDDVLVTGFDGIDEIFYTDPKITSCMCDYKKVAASLNEIIKSYFANEKIENDQRILPVFVKGCSCGCEAEGGKNRSINSINSGHYRFQDSERALNCIAERMQMSKTVEEIREKLNDDALLNMRVFLNKSCFDPTIVIENGDSFTTFDDTFIVMSNPKMNEPGPYEISRSNLYSNLEELTKSGLPIILSAVSTMNHLLGFACFCYNCSDILSYGKIPTILNALSNGVRGYMNLQRQLYLRDQMEKMYAYDSLTGLYNRMGFNKAYEQLIKEVIENQKLVTVILSDLDGLKTINDKYGHIIGDKAIVAIANALKESCPEDALCVRLGGDEMLAVIVGECNHDELCQRIYDYLIEYNKTGDIPCKVSTSLGVYSTSDPKMLEFDRLIIASDKEMYREKQIHHSKM